MANPLISEQAPNGEIPPLGFLFLMEIIFYYPNSPYFKSPPIRKLTSFPINPSPPLNFSPLFPPLSCRQTLPTTQLLPTTLMSSNSSHHSTPSHHSHVVKLFSSLNSLPPRSCHQTLPSTQFLASLLPAFFCHINCSAT